MWCHGSLCRTTHTRSSQPTRTDSGPPWRVATYNWHLLCTGEVLHVLRQGVVILYLSDLSNSIVCSPLSWMLDFHVTLANCDIIIGCYMVAIFSVYYVHILIFSYYYIMYITFVVFQLEWFKTMVNFLLAFGFYVWACVCVCVCVCVDI